MSLAHSITFPITHSLPHSRTDSFIYSYIHLLVQDINTINWKFTDRAYLRSYRGRRGNIDEAVASLKNHILWRIEKNVHKYSFYHRLAQAITHPLTRSIQPSDCEPFWSKRLTFLHKTDIEGRPVLYCVVKRHNKDDRAIDQVEKSIIYLIESALQQSKRDEEKVVVVFDLKDFSYKNMDFEATKLLVTILQTHYEEILKHALIINRYTNHL